MQNWVWVVSPDKTLHRHLFDLLSTGGDTTSTNMRDYFDNMRDCFDKKCETISTVYSNFQSKLTKKCGSSCIQLHFNAFANNSVSKFVLNIWVHEITNIKQAPSYFEMAVDNEHTDGEG